MSSGDKDMSNDLEIEAMSAISRALSPLDEVVVARIVRWVIDKHQVVVQPARVAPTPSEGAILQSKVPSEFADVATLYHAANPITEPEKALVVAFWLQEITGQKDWESQPVNTELKNLGHGIGNITDALSALMNRKPSLVIQVQKSGNSKQARKRYKITNAGLVAVREMLAAKEAKGE